VREKDAGSAPSSSATTLDLDVANEDSGKRLDVVLGRHPNVGSRSQAAALIASGAVTVEGVTAAKSRLLSAGERIRVSLPGAARVIAVREAPVPVVYEDEWLLVVDKPAGMPVHPSAGHASGTLVHALSGHGIAGGEEFRPGVVHRLDKDTSGLLVVAKSTEAHRRLVAMMRRRGIDRRYLALVHGGFAADSGTVEAPVGRDPVRRTSMTVGGLAAREATTHFSVLERLGDLTLVEARLETGRTHQIRVHFAAIGHPVAGDPVYGRRDPLGLGRQFLHSYRLAFKHPFTGEDLEFTAPLPGDLQGVLSRLEAEWEVPR
jgi:23S rRNA pseudouridine1911/1915/1917 synthase